MDNINVNKLITHLRIRISDLEYESMIKSVMIEELNEKLESHDSPDIPDEKDKELKSIQGA